LPKPRRPSEPPMPNPSSPTPSHLIDVPIHEDSTVLVICVDEDDRNGNYVMRVFPKETVKADEILLALYEVLRKMFVEVRGN